MNTKSKLTPAKKRIKTKHLPDSIDELEVQFNSTFDIEFPHLVQDNYRLDLDRASKVTKHILSVPGVEKPQFSDYLEINRLYPVRRNLVERGSLIKQSMTDKERETFTTAEDVAESGLLTLPEERESHDEPIDVDPLDVPERSSETPLHPSTTDMQPAIQDPTKAIHSLPIPKRIRTNRDIQKSEAAQSARTLHHQTTFRDEPPSSSWEMQEDTTPPVTLQKSTDQKVDDLIAEVKNLGNLIKAQSGIHTQVSDTHIEIRSLSAEVINMRSELSHIGNILSLLMSKVGDQSIGSTFQSTPHSQSRQETSIGDIDEIEEAEQMKKIASEYYDTHFTQFGFSGLTKILFSTLVCSKDAYQRAKKLYPGLQLPKETFACFANNAYSHQDMEVLNREFLRLGSTLHKDKYLPPGGTGVPYTPGRETEAQAARAPSLGMSVPQQSDDELRAFLFG
uniref:Phosphoprotein n=1 Tax=Cryptotermes secundus lispivirus 1 TaxID=3133545 RepID=A0AAT9JPZ2_9MONO